MDQPEEVRAFLLHSGQINRENVCTKASRDRKRVVIVTDLHTLEVFRVAPADGCELSRVGKHPGCRGDLIATYQ